MRKGGRGHYHMAPKLECPAGEGTANKKGKEARKRSNRKAKAKKKLVQTDARNAWKEQVELFTGGEPLQEPTWRGAKRHQRRALAAIQKLVEAGEDQQAQTTGAASSSTTEIAQAAPPIVLRGSAFTAVQAQGSHSCSDPLGVPAVAEDDVSTDSDTSSSLSGGSLDKSTNYRIKVHETPGGERGYSVHEARPTVAERVDCYQQRLAALKEAINTKKL